MTFNPADELAAYLPVRSLIPLIDDVREKVASSKQLPGCITLGIQIEKALRDTPLSILDIQQSLTDPLASSLRRLAAEYPIIESSSAKIADQFSVYREVLPHSDAELIKGHVIYDLYFRVSRFDPFPPGMLVRQIGLTLSVAIDELRRCGLSIDQVGDLLAASSLVVGTLGTSFNDADPSTGLHETVQSPNDVPSSFGSPTEVAFHRWRSGHHVFALISLFCRYFLECGLSAATSEKFDELCLHVDKATATLRGTTAAMWYAADFPAEIYGQEVRPSMESEKTPQGFSGTQNFDYERLKEARDLLHVNLVNILGERLKDWPEDLGESYLEFKEAELEDMENHILIAAKMVGRGASIFSSKNREEELPPPEAAVDMLRRMAEEKFRQLRGLVAR